MQDQNLQAHIIDAKNGNTEAFRRIFDHMHKRLFSYAMARTRAREDALDIVQETFIDLWCGLKNFRYESDEALYGFVFAIARRKLARYFKAQVAVVALDESIVNGNRDLQVNMKVNDDRYLFDRMNTLRGHYRDLLKHRYWFGMSFKEIASTMNITLATAKVWHHRAKQQLKKLLEKYDHAL